MPDLHHRDAFSPRAPRPPRLAPELKPMAAGEEARADDVIWSGVHAVGSKLRGEAEHLEFSRSRLETIDISAAAPARLSLTDCDLLGCNLANVAARAPSAVRCVVRRSRLTGIAWSAGTLSDVRFEDCRADLTSFRFAKLKRVSFVRCILVEADFEAVQADSVSFVDCDLSRSSFSQAHFERSEVRRCELDHLAGVEGLRGVGLLAADIVGLAGSLAAALGLRTLD